MDNEIRFIFTGDTDDYDKAVDDVVKKANKTKVAPRGKLPRSCKKPLQRNTRTLQRQAGMLLRLTKRLRKLKKNVSK